MTADDKDAERRAAMGDEHVERRRQQQQEEARISNPMHFAKAEAAAPRDLSVEQLIEHAVSIEQGRYVLIQPYASSGLGASLALMTKDEAKHALRQSTTVQMVGRGDERHEITVPNLDLWLRDPRTKTVNGVASRIGYPPIFQEPAATGTQLFANMWRERKRQQFEEPEDQREAALIVDAFIAHTRYLFPTLHELFFDFLAHCEQRPWERPQFGFLNTTPIYGTGRNLEAIFLNRVWPGEVALNVDIESMLFGGFNAHLECKRMAVVDEVHLSDDDIFRTASRLRQLMTATTRVINRKYGAQFVEYDVTRLLLFSNKPNALPMEAHERRIEVERGPDQPKSAEYYAEMYALRDHPLLGDAIGNWLAARDISKFNPGRRASLTEAKMELVRATQSEQKADLRQILERWPSDFITMRDMRGMLDLGPRDRKQINSLRHDLAEAMVKQFPTRLRTKQKRTDGAWKVVEDYIYLLPEPALPGATESEPRPLPEVGDEVAWSALREALEVDVVDALYRRAVERVALAGIRSAESRAVAAVNACRGAPVDEPGRDGVAPQTAAELIRALWDAAGDRREEPFGADRDGRRPS